MNDKLLKFNLTQRKTKELPNLESGDIVKVYRKIKEGEKERVQIFEGMIIAKRGGQSSSPTITVRKVTNGVGVELVLPVLSPGISKIELVKRAKIRRSKLYFIREKTAKSLKLKFQDIAKFIKNEEKEVAVEEKESVKKDIKKESAKEPKNTEAEAVEEVVVEKVEEAK